MSLLGVTDFALFSIFPFFLFFFFCVCVLFFSFCFFNELRWSNFFFVGNKFRRNNWIQSCCIPFSASTRLVVSRSGQFFFLLLLYTFSPISIGEILKGWIFIIAPPLTPSPHRFSISIVEIDSLSRDFDIKFSFFSEFCTWPKSFLFVIPEAKRNNKVTDYNLLKFFIGCTKNINFNFNQLSLVTVVNINYIY